LSLPVYCVEVDVDAEELPTANVSPTHS